MLKLVRGILAVVALLTSVSVGMPTAHAAACPDVDVTFARGTEEPPGVGENRPVIRRFLTRGCAGKSVGVYAVNYPAIKNWATAAQGLPMRVLTSRSWPAIVPTRGW